MDQQLGSGSKSTSKCSKDGPYMVRSHEFKASSTIPAQSILKRASSISRDIRSVGLSFSTSVRSRSTHPFRRSSSTGVIFPLGKTKSATTYLIPKSSSVSGVSSKQKVCHQNSGGTVVHQPFVLPGGSSFSSTSSITIPRQEAPSFNLSVNQSVRNLKENLLPSISDGALEDVKNDKWLNDEVMDFAMKQICQESNTKSRCRAEDMCQALSALFNQDLDSPWNGRFRNSGLCKVEYAKCNRVLFPLNHQNKHWSLIVIENSSHRFLHFDSMKSPNHEAYAQRICAALGRFFSQCFNMNDLGQYGYISRTSFQQNDSVSCGVLAVLNARIVVGISTDFILTTMSCARWRSEFGELYKSSKCIASEVKDPNRSIKAMKRSSNPKVTKASLDLPNVNLKSTVSLNEPFTTSLAELAETLNLGGIMKRVPKGARPETAKLLTMLIKEVVRNNNRESWIKLLCFPSLCLKPPPGRLKRRILNRNLTSHVKEQVMRFSKDWLSMYNSREFRRPCRQLKKQTKASLKHEISSKLSDGDVKGAVRLLCSEEHLAPNNDVTLTSLQSKHPKRASDSDIPSQCDDLSQPRFVDALEVQRAVQNFPPGSTGGLDGLRPQHLKDLISRQLGEISHKLVCSLVDFVSFLGSGQILDEARSVFFGARLIAFSKKDGGVRPIAVGNTLRRLTSKIFSRVVTAEAVEKFSPIQVGFGVRKGAEAAVHTVRKFVSASEGSKKVLLKIDFRNAFNTLRRDHMLRAVEREFPSLLPYLWSCYALPSKLLWNDNVLWSEEGVQQGDPLGPFLFCLGINDIMHQLSSELNMWYLDDGTLGGDLDDVYSDFQRIIEGIKKFGLDINTSKCEFFVLSNDQNFAEEAAELFTQIAPGIKNMDYHYGSLLGSVIHPDGVDSALDGKLASLQQLCSRLYLLDRHDALYLLRNCFAIPKLLYLLRTAPCFRSERLFNYDDLLKTSLEEILNCGLTDFQWSMASMPVSFGGLGVRSASGLAYSAFLASFNASKRLSDSMLPTRLAAETDAIARDAMEGWNKKGLGVPVGLGFQKEWDTISCEAIYSEFLRSLGEDRIGRARLMAARSKHSGAWLNCVPISNLGLKLNDNELRIAAALRIGAKVCQKHLCICGALVDEQGSHGLSCKFSAGRRSRHHHVNDILRRALTSAGFPSILEPVGISRSDGKRPDGLTLIPWKSGKSLIWDYTCPDSLAPSHITSASSEAGKVAAEAETKKFNKYHHLQSCYEFVAIGIETLGAWGPGAMDFLKKIGSILKQASGEPRAQSFLVQSISIAVQRGNAGSVMGSLPTSEKLTYCLDSL